jgi:hypothetical protein
VRHNVRQLAHHPSIVIWDGQNSDDWNPKVQVKNKSIPNPNPSNSPLYLGLLMTSIWSSEQVIMTWVAQEVRKTHFLSHLVYSKRSTYQDRLGTNKQEKAEKEGVFCTGPIAYRLAGLSVRRLAQRCRSTYGATTCPAGTAGTAATAAKG